MEKETLFGCVFCGGLCKPTMIERKRIAVKCENCTIKGEEIVHFFAYHEKSGWVFEHSEISAGCKEKK
jgi:hypothetical protein